jgi:hypothetical protein
MTAAETTASAAPSVAAATTTSAANSAAAALAAEGERRICRANRNPERADAGGESQDNKLSSQLFANRAADLFADERSHDVSFP